MKHRSSSRIRKTLIVGVIGLSVFGLSARPVAAASFFEQVQQSITGQFEKLYLQLLPGEKPGKLVLKQVGIAAQNLKSFEGKTTVQVNAQSAGASIGSGLLTMTGPTVIENVWDTQSYKQDMRVVGSFTLSGKVYDAEAQVRMVDGVTYVQATKLPDIGVSLTDLQNTWIKFSPMDASTSAQPTPAQYMKMQDAFYSMLNSSEVSSATTEKKDGNDVYVLSAVLSKPAVAQYLSTLRQIEAESAQTPQLQEVTVVQAETEQMLQNVGEIKATFWVDKRTFFPRHMELPLQVNMQDVTESSPLSAIPQAMPINEIDQADIVITSDLSRHNEQMTIVAPEGAQDSQVFFTKMMGAFMPGLTGVGSMGAPVIQPGVMNYRVPTTGTSELPTMSVEQKKALEQYELMMRNLPNSEQ